jgi:hypothetical protein
LRQINGDTGVASTAGLSWIIAAVSWTATNAGASRIIADKGADASAC